MYISFLRNLFHEINFSDVLLLTITGQQQNTAIFSLSHNKPTDFFPVPPPNSTQFETPLKFRRTSTGNRQTFPHYHVKHEISPNNPKNQAKSTAEMTKSSLSPKFCGIQEIKARLSKTGMPQTLQKLHANHRKSRMQKGGTVSRHPSTKYPLSWPPGEF